ncbi:MAG: Fic family protein, partial [Phycisphaerales bacterium]|nr:Fic family protein [Phycisphaerales bacterium]
MDSTPTLPEPLLAFDEAAATMAPRLAEVDRLASELLRRAFAGRILPGSLEALRLELTYHSNAIEGSTLTLRDTQLIVEGLSPPGGKSLREVYEARNHDRALRVIESWGPVDADAAALERELLEVHSIVLADIDPPRAGRLRSERVLIAGTRFVPPGPHRFELLLPALLGRAGAGGLHPIAKAAELHYNLVAVHPFVDGNGRTARLMMNRLLLAHDYPLAVIDVGERA